MKTALFPGSFDPFTIGHLDIVRRGLELFDQIVIGIGQNGEKQPFLSPQFRLDALQQLFAQEPRVSVCLFDSLTVDFARQCEAQFILRGVRSVQDFEYERAMADINRQLTGIETVLLYARSEYASVSSSVVRDLYKYQHDVSRLVPYPLP